MFINKTGFDHVEYGINNQDFGIENEDVKCIVDGCSEGKHSEVGAKLFCHLLNKFGSLLSSERKLTIDLIFTSILNIIGYEAKDIRDYMCFTTLYVVETEKEFIANICGDGYIIKHTIDDKIEYEKIDNGKYPIYYAYNYTPKESLGMYKDGVNFQEYRFSKDEYKSIGVASDGLRYIFGKEFETEFTNLILKRKVSAIKRLINREHKHFKDDITLVI